MKAVEEFRAKALNPEHPKMRGSHENGDVFFQHREACNSVYNALPAVVEKYMGKINEKPVSYTHLDVYKRQNLGRVVDEFRAECEGEEVEIGFNNRYLLDALRNARTEQVKMEISGPLSPVKGLPAEGNDFLYLVLPVRFKND